MQLKIDKSFEKDLDKISDKKLFIRILSTIEHILIATSIIELKDCKMLVGFKGYYRIKIGDYRIGFKYENGFVVLERFLHRKDIYKFFP